MHNRSMFDDAELLYKDDGKIAACMQSFKRKCSAPNAKKKLKMDASWRGGSNLRDRIALRRCRQYGIVREGSVELHQVRYFLSLCESLNFTRAATACHVSQPSLTRAIKALEEELGGPLFHRERNQSHLTDLGRIMRPYLEDVWANLNLARGRAESFVKLKEAPLAVGLMCTIGPTKLVDLFSAFHERHPGIDLHLRDGTAEALRDALATGDLDVAVFGMPDGIDERFHAQPLFTERFVIAVAPTHPFARQDVVRFRDLNSQRYLVRWNCEVWQQFEAALRKQGVEPLRPYRSERDDWLQAMILAGLGFGFFPECAVTLPGVVKRPLVEPEITRTISLVNVRGRPHSPAVGAFVREAIRHRWKAEGDLAADARSVA